MPLYKSQRIRLEPNNVTETLLYRHAGCARYAYNWAIDVCDKVYGEIKYTPSAFELTKMFIRMEKSKHEWLNEVSKCATQAAIQNFEKAIKSFHLLQKASGYKKTRKDGQRVHVLQGLPQRKKRGGRDSFYLETDGVRLIKNKNNYIKLPKIGWVKCSEHIPEGVAIKSCVVSRHADEWFVSFKFEFEPTKHHHKSRVGVDLGIKALATVSDGMVFQTSKRYVTLNRKLKRQQQALARKYEQWKLKQAASKKDKDNTAATSAEDKRVPMSNNYRKARLAVAKTHKRIFDHRRDGVHKATSYLTKNHGQVVIEDLNVRGMMKNGNLSRHIANGAFYEFRRQLEYKGKFYGCEIIVADRFFPSSKLCSCCGAKNEKLKLAQREWTCENCGTEHDRDLNASYNLKNYVPKGDYTASSAVKVCGEGSSACGLSPSVKQKINNNPE